MADLASIELRAERALALDPANDNIERAMRTRRPRTGRPAAAAKGAGRALAIRALPYKMRRIKSFGSLLFALAVVVALIIGWRNRGEGYLAAEEGLGYALGILGGTMMLLLLLYPLRKRLKILRPLGLVKHWFRLHMILGVLGPVLVLFHANFKFGSVNSSVALSAMLIVALSGVVGRYIYGKIHMGLYGRKAEVREILDDALAFKRAVGADVADLSEIEAELRRFEKLVFAPDRGALGNLWLLLSLSLRTDNTRKRMQRDARHIIRQQAKLYGWPRRERKARLKAAETHLTDYFTALNKAAQFSFYERMFALWHVLHLPLFFFLVLAAVVHVIAVHLY